MNKLVFPNFSFFRNSFCTKIASQFWEIFSKAFFAFLFCLASFSLTSSKLHAGEISDLLESGQKAVQEGNFEKASEIFSMVLEKNPNSEKAMYGFSLASLEIGDLDSAKLYSKKLIELNPKNYEGQILYARVLRNTNAIAEARSRVDYIYSTNYRSKELQALDIELLYDQGKKESAREKIESILSPSFRLLLLLGKIYRESNRLDKSEEVLTNVVNNYRSSVEAHLELIKTQYKINLERALTTVQTALLIHPDSISLQKWKSKILYALGKETEAFSLMSSLSDKSSFSLEEISFYSYLSLRTNQHLTIPEIQEELSKSNNLSEIQRIQLEDYALENEEENSSVRKRLGDYRKDRYILEKSSFFQYSAERELKRAILLFPSDPFLQREYITLMTSRKEDPELFRTLLRLRTMNPKNFKIQQEIEEVLKRIKQSLAYQLGYVKIESGDFSYSNPESSTTLFVFPLKPNFELGWNTYYPLFLRKSIQDELSVTPGINLETEESAIQKLNRFDGTTKATYFSPSLTPYLPKSVRYILHGEIHKMGPEQISFTLKLFDRNLGRDIASSKMEKQGKNILYRIVREQVQEILKSIKIPGDILKIQLDGVIVNKGIHDGFALGAKAKIPKKDLEGSVVQTESGFSKIQFPGNAWKESITRDDTIFLSKEEKNALPPQK